MGTAFGGLAGSTESHENQTKLQFRNSLTDDERSMLFSVKQDTRRYLGAG